MINFKTKNSYTGQNVEILAGSSFTSQFWMTYRQAQEMGYQVRKGSEGTRLMKVIEKEVKNKLTGKLEKKKLPKYFTVFNMDQMDKIEEAA